MSLVVVGRCGGEVFLEPVRGFCGGLECTEWVEKAGFAVRMLEWGCSAAICLGRSRVRAVCWFVVAEGYSASHDGSKSLSCR